MPTQTAYDQIERLVTKYKSLPARARREYNEDNTRKDFVLPLFRALEWNVDDMREVAAEEKISRGYVDFSFRINGVPRFMLETKRIGEDLSRPDFAQQAIEYAYHKDVTWAVLTDFEGLRIFNAEAKEPNPLQAVFKDFTVDNYLTRLDELWWLSRAAMVEGTLDQEGEKAFKRSIRTPITTSLFDNLTKWRGALYKNLRAYNPLLSAADIDAAVQRILDRLIFVRTAEDRKAESDTLLALVHDLRERNRPNDLLPALVRRFREVDAGYNSQLFAPHFSENLDLGEPTTLVDIISGLTNSPGNMIRYNFSFIDADVLGRVYEEYLGYVVSEREQLEEKQAKRKAQGIYYTPIFIVKYIVAQTLGRYLEEHDYGTARTVRVLDPACGSGSFLIEAFDVLDNYLAGVRNQQHGQYGVHDIARQKEILTRNLYGVDKDKQAVEVAQLNLLLKALHTRERLPKLENIRWGDSLISGTDGELETCFGRTWKERNPFNWEDQFRKEIADGGFDVIVGNPPYGMHQPHNTDRALLTYFNAKYRVAQFKIDMFHLFIERCINLLREGWVPGTCRP